MELLTGKPIFEKKLPELKKRIEIAHRKNPSLELNIVTAQFGDDPASKKYDESIAKTFEQVDIRCEYLQNPENTPKWKAMELLNTWNKNPDIQGILINQPLPPTLSSLNQNISSGKDMEGMTPFNLGKLLLGESAPYPCTPMSIMMLLREYEINLQGMKTVVIGRSSIVGKPIAMLLTHANATVTICHSKTKNLPEEVRKADLVIAAIGKANFIQGDWIKPGAIVIDVGTNYIPEKGLTGDVDFETAKHNASKITPVPKGVGSLTHLMLLTNYACLLEASISK